MFTFLIVWHFALSTNPIMFSGEHSLIKGKSDFRAMDTARAVLPHPTGPVNQEGPFIFFFHAHATKKEICVPSCFQTWLLNVVVSHSSRFANDQFAYVLIHFANVSSQFANVS